MSSDYGVTVPTFLTGNSANEAMQNMYKLSIKSGKQYKIINIYYANKKHYIWYYEQVPFLRKSKNE